MSSRGYCDRPPATGLGNEKKEGSIAIDLSMSERDPYFGGDKITLPFDYIPPIEFNYKEFTDVLMGFLSGKKHITDDWPKVVTNQLRDYVAHKSPSVAVKDI